MVFGLSMVLLIRWKLKKGNRLILLSQYLNLVRKHLFETLQPFQLTYGGGGVKKGKSNEGTRVFK